METVFKIGDKVYCVINGHGIVKKVMRDNNYPVYVKFENDSSNQYTFDGKLYKWSLPILSFTEYTLQGFSQERPIELPKVGDWCLVRDSEQTVWQAGLFKEYRNNNEFPFVTDIGSWKEIKRIKILD